jgi:N-acetylneuraminate synthase
MSVFVIAEAGVNHNGEHDKALALIDAAADAGADAVKFQTFRAGELATADAPKADYQIRATDEGESQLDMLKRLELPREWHHDLAERSREKGIQFLSTPFDRESLRFLAGEMKLEILKIPSGEITNGPLLLEAGRSGCKIILSTGMSTLKEIEEALSVLAFGMMEDGKEPSRDAFKDAFASDQGQAALRENMTVLHCTTEYPAPVEDANLKAMETMRDEFGLRVGLSDHTEGIAVAIAAAGLGATVIEKHFTLDHGLPGPDHQASLEPGELTEMIAGVRSVAKNRAAAVRVVEQAMGDGKKVPRPSEIKNMVIARKSLVALRPIKSGETFTENNLGVKRPGGGISPMSYWAHLGRKAERDLAEGEVLS